MSTRPSWSLSAFGSVRHRTTGSLAVILACAVAWILPTALTATAAPRIVLTVRVYQTADLPSLLEQRALAEAEALLRAGFVDVRWQGCTGPTLSPACDVPPGPSERVLVVRAGPPCQDTSAKLGEAFVVRRAGGVLATVHFNCVAWLATTARMDVAVLLGRVVAHELGHLMMHTSAHARRGLMRQFWTPEEVRRNRAADWAFTAGDVAAMRQHAPEY